MNFRPDIDTSSPITGLKPLNKTYLTDSEFDDHKRRLAFIESLSHHPRGEDPEIVIKLHKVRVGLQKALLRGKHLKIPRFAQQVEWGFKRLAQLERQVIDFVVNGKEISQETRRREELESILWDLLSETASFEPIDRPENPLISMEEMAGLKGRNDAAWKFWNSPYISHHLYGVALMVAHNFFANTCTRAAATEFSQEGRRRFDIMEARIRRLEHLIVLAFVDGQCLETLVIAEFVAPNNAIPVV